MANDTDVIQLFREAALKTAGRELGELTLETELSDLGLDSVLVLEIVLHMEQRLNVRFEDAALAHLSTLRDMQDLIDKLRQAR